MARGRHGALLTGFLSLLVKTFSSIDRDDAAARRRMGTMMNARNKTVAQQAAELSVVVPCYNEADGLAELHQRTSDVCRQCVGNAYEIVLVNDGSTDGSWAEIVALSERDEHLVGINLARNYGHQLALSAGLEVCKGERALILDADLQDPPELLPQMMALMDEGYDVVYGQRNRREGETWFKRTSAALFYRLLGRMVDVSIPHDTGDFRLISRRALDHLNRMPERYRFIRGMISWIGLRQVPIAYERSARFVGQSHYPLKKMLLLALDAMTSFSLIPLRFASHVGLSFGLLGLTALAYTVVSWLRGAVVPGWTSLAALILILGSVQLLVLGIFGEYLGRMYMEMKRRPLYIVDQIVGKGAPVSDIVLPVHTLQMRAREAVDARG